jgi:hypothetical protein
VQRAAEVEGEVVLGKLVMTEGTVKVVVMESKAEAEQ